MSELIIRDIPIANDAPLVAICGPCQLESLDHARMLAERIAAAADAAGMRFVFKGSFDKANRSSGDAIRGVGIEAGLTILSKIRHEFGCPVLTDVHAPAQCAMAAQAVDVLQIPAFLCRQTDLLTAAGETGAAINVKKGQFLAPWDMVHVADKIRATGNHRIMLCERGASFGYNMLVSDMRSLPIMARQGDPVVFDATHSVQLPGGQGGASGGQREFVPVLARAAVAVGVAALFAEVHDAPDRAPSDGPSMLRLEDLAPLLRRLKALDQITKARA